MSIIFGLLVCLIPIMLFAKIALQANSDPQKILRRFYLGIIIKFMALVILVVLSLSWFNLEPVWFIIAFSISQFVMWFGMLALNIFYEARIVGR